LLRAGNSGKCGWPGNWVFVIVERVWWMFVAILQIAGSEILPFQIFFET
jgi:hypothetical protein